VFEDDRLHGRMDRQRQARRITVGIDVDARLELAGGALPPRGHVVEQPGRGPSAQDRTLGIGPSQHDLDSHSPHPSRSWMRASLASDRRPGDAPKVMADGIRLARETCYEQVASSDIIRADTAGLDLQGA
jgi:hypothetical protein